MSHLEIVDASEISEGEDFVLARGSNVRAFTIETDMFLLGPSDVVRYKPEAKSEIAPAQVPAPQG